MFYKTIFLVQLNADAAIYIAFVGRDELLLVKISVTASKFISVSVLTLLCFNKHFITMSRTNYVSYKTHYIEYLV